MSGMGVGTPRGDLEQLVARVLMAATYASVALVAAGVVLMTAQGISPFDAARALDPGALLADLGALRPEAFLWIGLVAVIATPSVRVAVSMAGYASGGERTMALISAAILGVVAASVVLAIGLQG